MSEEEDKAEELDIMPDEDVAPKVEPEAHVEIPGVRKRRDRAGILVGVLLLAAAGLGFYAWTLRSKNAAASVELTQSQDDLSSERAKGIGIASQLASCKKERDDSKAGSADNEKAVAAAQADLTATRGELDELRRERAESESRLAAFKSITAKFQKMVDTGKLKVMIRDGRMIVKLPAEIFFASGQADLAKDATPALREIASILRQFPDRRFEVSGHTDNIPLHSPSFKSNWELSTARAVTVTEVLVAGGMIPGNLVAAGYGPYDPVANNKSEPGRKENRRIEIALLPNIKELPALPPDAAGPSPSASAASSASAAPSASAAAPPK